MSAGAFEQGVYESDTAELHVCRYQPETTQATFGGVANTINPGIATSPFWVKVSKGAREYGLKVRTVKLRWTGAPPAGYKEGSTVDVMIMTPSVFNGITLNGGATYLGADAQIIGKTPEMFYPGI